MDERAPGPGARGKQGSFVMNGHHHTRGTQAEREEGITFFGDVRARNSTHGRNRAADRVPRVWLSGRQHIKDIRICVRTFTSPTLALRSALARRAKIMDICKRP